MVASKTCCNPLIERRARKQVARQLFGQKAIIRHVFVEALNDPIAPAPHRAFGVVIETVGVGIARDVQPIHRHPLTVRGRSQQAIDCGNISSFPPFLRLLCEGGRLTGRRRQTDEIERDASQPSAGRRLRAGAKTFRPKPLQNKTINRLAHPCIRGLRNGGPDWRQKGPVLGVLAAFFDPAFQNGDLFRREVLVCRQRRHAPRSRLCRDPLIDKTLFRLAWN